MALERFGSALSGSNPNHFVQIRHEDLSIADLSRSRGANERFNHVLGFVVADHDFDFHFGQEFDGVFRASVMFLLTFLASKPADFGDRHSLDANLRQCIFDFFEFEMSNDSFNLFHGPPL